MGGGYAFIKHLQHTRNPDVKKSRYNVLSLPVIPSHLLSFGMNGTIWTSMLVFVCVSQNSIRLYDLQLNMYCV